jgi:hypothetical protein
VTGPPSVAPDADLSHLPEYIREDFQRLRDEDDFTTLERAELGVQADERLVEWLIARRRRGEAISLRRIYAAVADLQDRRLWLAKVEHTRGWMLREEKRAPYPDVWATRDDYRAHQRWLDDLAEHPPQEGVEL